MWFGSVSFGVVPFGSIWFGLALPLIGSRCFYLIRVKLLILCIGVCFRLFS